MRAMGNPVALEASAEERDTRGFISITTISPVARFSANCTLAPPVSTPTARTTWIAASRSSCCSWSSRVMAGATVTESPVCTPIGSRFSMVHTITALSLRSRTTSSSISSHPVTDRSISTWEIGLAASAFDTTGSRSSGVSATPPPSPPSVNAGRRMMGYPRASAAARADSGSVAIRLSSTGTPTSRMRSLNRSRSSARRITSTSAPISSTPCRSSTPASDRSMARFSAVWPPRVGRIASGRSASMMRSAAATSSGST